MLIRKQLQQKRIHLPAVIQSRSLAASEIPTNKRKLEETDLFFTRESPQHFCANTITFLRGRYLGTFRAKVSLLRDRQLGQFYCKEKTNMGDGLIYMKK